MRFAMITLNPVDPAVRYALADRERLHAIISASCTGRPLWRWERDRIHLVADRIDTDRLTARLGHPAIRVTDYDRALGLLTVGDRLTVDVDANMTVCHEGRRRPLPDDAARRAWTERTFRVNGFDVHDVALLDHRIDTVDANRRRLTVDHALVRVDATILDPAGARRMLTRGVGRARAFGFGLPLVARRIPADVSSDTSQGAAL